MRSRAIRLLFFTLIYSLTSCDEEKTTVHTLYYAGFIDKASFPLWNPGQS